jgi:hypothetical protein
MALTLPPPPLALQRCKLQRRARIRGTTSIEMLMCFLILVTVWFGLAQLSLVGVGRLVVQHAAHRAARSAIVILDDDPEEYEKAPRGLISGEKGEPRLAAIRKAAYAPLSILAPPVTNLAEMALGRGGTLKGAISTDLTSAGWAALYNPIAAAVTLERDGAPAELFDAAEPVTAHVAYLFHCRVPLVARLICTSYPELKQDKETAKKLERVEKPDDQALLKVSGQYFLLLEGQETLPNQAANYHNDETSAGESGPPAPSAPEGV